MKKLLLLLLGLLPALPSLAYYDFHVDGIYYYINEDGTTCSVSNGVIKYSGVVTIPASITCGGTKYSVTKIGNLAFYGSTGLTSVTIPNSVTEIGAEAFSGSGLTSVTIPNSVTEISAEAFSGSSRLTSINVSAAHKAFSSENGVLFNKTKSILICYPGGKTGSYIIPNSVTEIGDWAFCRCRGLTSVTIPNSVTSIVNAAFIGCSGLTSMTIPNSVTSIGISVTAIGYGSFVFRGCSKLAELVIEDGDQSLTLGYNLRHSSYPYWGEGLFYDCPLEKLYLGRNLSYKTGEDCGFSPFSYNASLKEVTISNSVTEIGSSAFSGCSGMTSVTIGNSVKTIGISAFSGCSGLTSVTIGNSVIVIGKYAFYDCSGLTSVTIPNSVTIIGNYAFDGCSGLTSVTIPNSVTEIGYYAFKGCSGLQFVTYLAENPIDYYSNLFESEVYENATLNYLRSAGEKIATTTPWSLFVKRIGRDADFVDSITEVRGFENETTAVYDMRGVRVGDSLEGLPHGVYIIRQGSKTTKHAI